MYENRHITQIIGTSKFNYNLLSFVGAKSLHVCLLKDLGELGYGVLRQDGGRDGAGDLGVVKIVGLWPMARRWVDFPRTQALGVLETVL